MSIQAVSWVLDHSESKGYARLVLIALANHAHSETGECHPGQRSIAREAGISLGAVGEQIDKLVALGEVAIVEKGGARRTTKYQLTFVQQLNESGASRSGAERSGAERSVQSRAARSVQSRGEQNHQLTVREEDASSTSTPPLPLTPAERWTRRWCEIRGVVPTRAVLRSWIPKVNEFIASGGEPSEDLLEAAHAAGIETPGGWPYVTADLAGAQDRRRAHEWMMES